MQGREGSAMTAQTVRIDAAFGWLAHRPCEGQALHEQGRCRHPERAPRAELRDGPPLADTVTDGYAECCFTEHDRDTRGLDSQLRLDTREPRRTIRQHAPKQIVRRVREESG
jgi:hypothetical protein